VSEACLIIFARAPVTGQVKTRLFSTAPGPGLRPLRADEAAALYRAFLTDVCAAGVRAGFPRRCLYVAGPPHPFLTELARDQGFALKAQRDGDLGQRMEAALAAEHAAGAQAAVLIGSDSPTVAPEELAQAARLLLCGDAHLVLGPATDHGYWLVGARRHSPYPALFSPGIAWGTGAVLPETLLRLAQAAQAGLRVHLLPFLYDVDTPADLRLLISHLALLQAPGQVPAASATWATLRELGLLPAVPPSAP
jgi:hypothetical protein